MEHVLAYPAVTVSSPRQELSNRLRDRTVGGEHRRRWILVTALAGMFATSFPITVLAVSLQDIAHDFHVSEPTITWVITAPVLLGAIALPVVGKLGDLFGHRRVYLRGFFVAALLMGATAAAWNAPSLIALRTLGQVSGAATLPSSMALIISEFPPEERVRPLGWWSLVAAGAPALGLAVGGPLVDVLGWRMIFMAQASIAFVALAAALVVLPETRRRERVSFDIRGALTLSLGSGGLLFALNQGGTWGWVNLAVLTGFAVAPVGLLAFVAAERRALEPLLPLDLLRRRNFSAAITTVFFFQAAYMGGFIITPLLLGDRFGYSIATISFVMLVRPTTYSALSPVGGRVATIFGERQVVLLGGGCMVTAMMLFVGGATSGSLLLVLAALILQGAANGLARPSITASAANAAGADHFGVAGATQRMLGQLGTATGITVLVLLATGGSAAHTGPYATAYAAGAGLALIGAIAGSFIVSERRVADVPADGSRPPRVVADLPGPARI